MLQKPVLKLLELKKEFFFFLSERDIKHARERAKSVRVEIPKNGLKEITKIHLSSSPTLSTALSSALSSALTLCSSVKVFLHRPKNGLPHLSISSMYTQFLLQ
jgi:hypothetical protein